MRPGPELVVGARARLRRSPLTGCWPCMPDAEIARETATVELLDRYREGDVERLRVTLRFAPVGRDRCRQVVVAAEYVEVVADAS